MHPGLPFAAPVDSIIFTLSIQLVRMSFFEVNDRLKHGSNISASYQSVDAEWKQLKICADKQLACQRLQRRKGFNISELVYYKCYVTASDLTQGSITHADTRMRCCWLTTHNACSLESCRARR